MTPPLPPSTPQQPAAGTIIVSFFTFLVLVFATFASKQSQFLRELFFETGIIYLLWLFWLGVNIIIVAGFFFGKRIPQKLLFYFAHEDDFKRNEDEFRKRRNP